MISLKQCRAARALLDWNQPTLSDKSGVSTNAIVKFENGQTNPIKITLRILRQTFEQEGIKFLDNNGVEVNEEKL